MEPEDTNSCNFTIDALAELSVRPVVTSTSGLEWRIFFASVKDDPQVDSARPAVNVDSVFQSQATTTKTFSITVFHGWISNTSTGPLTARGPDLMGSVLSHTGR